MSKKKLTGYKAAAAYVAEMGLGSCTYRPTKTEGSNVVPVMRMNGEDKSVPVMYWRLSHHSQERLTEVLETFQRSGYRVVTPPDEGILGTLLGRDATTGALYIDVQFEQEEIGPGIKPRTVLIRGESDKVEKAKAEA